MEICSHYACNGNVRLHYMESTTESKLTPMVICPGLSETAEEYRDLIQYLYPRRCIAISFRGRGQSDTPCSGYRLEDHVSDIEAVTDAAGIGEFHMYAYSRGVSYALGYIERRADSVRSLILQDYPPEHKKMSIDWANHYINHYLIPQQRLDHIRSEAVNGIQRDSKPISFTSQLNHKLLILRGTLEGSLLNDDDLNRYTQMSSDVKVVDFKHSAHDIRSTEKKGLYQTIRQFMDTNSQ